MALTDHERVGKAMELLQRGLGPTDNPGFGHLRKGGSLPIPRRKRPNRVSPLAFFALFATLVGSGMLPCAVLATLRRAWQCRARRARL